MQDLIKSLKMIDQLAQMRNATVGSHCRRVARLCAVIGRHLAFDPRTLFELEVAALFHDIGKVGVTDQVLDKQLEKLTPEEKGVLRSHVVAGEVYLSEIQDLGMVPKFVRHHHEHFDGSGYPDKLAGENIPLGSRIIAVADAYDKVSFEAAAGGGQGEAIALEFLKENTEKLFDRKVVAALIECLANKKKTESEISIADLLPGMVLSRSLKNVEGRMIAAKGHSLTRKNIDTIQDWLAKDPSIKTVYIKESAQNTADGVIKLPEDKLFWE